jgi:hypothetical protein
MPFQSKVNLYQAPGVEGDFASMNPFSSVLAGGVPGQGGGQLVAPATGLAVGRFAFVDPATNNVSQSYKTGYQVGFVGRNEQALITQFLGEYTLVIPGGFMVNLFNGGDFFARFPAGATQGQKVYADPNTGLPISSASAPAAASGTGSAGVTGTLTTVNGSTTVTVNTVSAGIFAVGDTVVSANVPVGTVVVAQLTVTAGSGAGLLGTYQLSAAATAAAGPTAFTSTSTVLDLTAVAGGAFEPGDVITGTGVTAGTTIVSQAAQFSGVANLATSTALVVTSVSPTSGKLRVGDVLVAAGIPAGTTVASQTSGTPGGVGTYVMSAASTVTQNAVAVTDANIPGQTGRYVVSVAQNFASTNTIATTGTAVATGFVVASNCGDNEVAKISASVL